MDLRETYNKIAIWSEELFGNWGIEGLNKFVSLLDKGADVLDLGCGSGIESKIMADKGLSVLGVDFSEKMIEIAREKVPNAKFELLDIYNLDQLEKKFDGIFVRAVLLHFPKNETFAILEKIKNKLKEGGYLYIALKERKGREKEEKIVKKEFNGLKFERFFSYFKTEEIEGILEKLEMNVVYKETLKMRSRNWIILIAQK